MACLFQKQQLRKYKSPVTNGIAHLKGVTFTLHFLRQRHCQRIVTAIYHLNRNTVEGTEKPFYMADTWSEIRDRYSQQKALANEIHI